MSTMLNKKLYASYISHVSFSPTRTITNQERTSWNAEILKSRFGLQQATEMLFHKEVYVIQANLHHVSVSFITNKPRPPYSVLSKLRLALARVAMLRTEPLNYVILPCKEKRYWPLEGDYVKEENINGGFTYKTGNDVFIFREEEFPKVMLHEALHHSVIDVPMLLDGVEQLFRSTFNLSPNMILLVNEGIVEAFATLYNAQFVAADNNISWHAIWSVEYNWIKKQALEVLRRMRSSEWYETTNSFSYMVIRWLCCLQQGDIASLEELINARKPLLGFFERQIAKMESHSVSPLPPASSMRLTMFGDF